MTMPAQNTTAREHRTARKLNARKEPKMQEPTMKKELITPAIAAEYLKANRNRRLRSARVDWYAAVMLLGRWMLGTDGIGFDRDGYLINGQHRLQAVIKSGVAVEMWVMRNLDPAVTRFLDGGDGRQLSDHIGMSANPENANTRAAVAKRLTAYVKLGGLNRTVSSGGTHAKPGSRNWAFVDDYLEMAQKYAPLSSAVKYAVSRRKAAQSLRMTKSQIALLYCLYNPWHPGIADFIDRVLLIRVPHGVGDPARLLNMRLAASATGPTNNRFDAETVLGYMVIAANHDFKGTNLSKLSWPKSDEFPQPLVQVADLIANEIGWATNDDEPA